MVSLAFSGLPWLSTLFSCPVFLLWFSKFLAPGGSRWKPRQKLISMLSLVSLAFSGFPWLSAFDHFRCFNFRNAWFRKVPGVNLDKNTFRLGGLAKTLKDRYENMKVLLHNLQKNPSQGLKSSCNGLNKALCRPFSGPS